MAIFLASQVKLNEWWTRSVEHKNEAIGMDADRGYGRVVCTIKWMYVEMDTNQICLFLSLFLSIVEIRDDGSDESFFLNKKNPNRKYNLYTEGRQHTSSGKINLSAIPENIVIVIVSKAHILVKPALSVTFLFNSDFQPQSGQLIAP